MAPNLKWLQFNTLGTWLTTRLSGTSVGKDDLGNAYYRKRGKSGRWQDEKRWVVFVGEPDPTSVPPGWYGWLHHRIEKSPADQPLTTHQRWEKERLPNLTGTAAAYLPPGDVRRGGQRLPAPGDYEAWRPE
ncbi:NADH:ubiquinone oxidoreductase subunit NDUFA12 [Marinivivus vitaminiproducens]|uniref:NADH:ubiquinone oxidoreductase subunit NDUFA12 n=1 Tax=Marinivivus vitaminiproducens TaxID=3035935 RepID=UPI00279B415A|nr:NADH:ubiquinone oxidoreductase subunit NDUFA12 [Geminicoccaceae bacterium SCSIO 64248]